jgi:hypothetical protein
MAIPPDDPHFQPDMLSGEAMPRSLIKSLRPGLQNDQDSLENGEQVNGEPVDGEPQEDKPKPIILASPDDIIGCSFLLDLEADGQRFRAKVVEKIESMDHELEHDKDRIKYLCVLNDDEREEIITYNQILDCLNRDAENAVLWKYKRIVSHQGPLKCTDKD